MRHFSLISVFLSRLSTEEGDYLLDLNSRNGTTVNGVPLMGETKKKLEDGDDISFAGKKYRSANSDPADNLPLLY